MENVISFDWNYDINNYILFYISRLILATFLANVFFLPDRLQKKPCHSAIPGINQLLPLESSPVLAEVLMHFDSLLNSTELSIVYLDVIISNHVSCL